MTQKLYDKYLSFLVPPRPNIKFPRYNAGNGHSCNTSANQLINYKVGASETSNVLNKIHYQTRTALTNITYNSHFFQNDT